MAGIKVPQYEIFKIGTKKLKYNNWDLKITKDEAFKYLISSSSKKMKRLYFNITKSVIAAMDLIDEAKESGCNINKVDLEYLNVYYDDLYCDFDEFLNQIAKFEELGGKDFEEYWDLIYVFGFTPEMAVRSYNDCN